MIGGPQTLLDANFACHLVIRILVHAKPVAGGRAMFLMLDRPGVLQNYLLLKLIDLSCTIGPVYHYTALAFTGTGLRA